MSRRVLDASALLAYLNDEPGAPLVKAAIAETAFISAVNWAEVLSKIVDIGKDLDKFSSECRTLVGSGIEVVSFADYDAMLAARLRSATKGLGLSLGDRACLALAKKLHLPVLTADRSWKKLKIAVEIEAIR